MFHGSGECVSRDTTPFMSIEEQYYAHTLLSNTSSTLPHSYFSRVWLLPVQTRDYALVALYV